MRSPWSRLFTPKSTRPPRIYAIGDIHGRLDLFKVMVRNIKDDVAQRPPRATRIIVLGDFIDRGPDSAAVIDVFMRLQRQHYVIVLKGNHEAVMIDALTGDHAALDLWLTHGGAATLASFGMDTAAINPDDARSTLRAAQNAVPRAVLPWMKRLPTHVRYGNHYFVHAGIKPGVALAEQTDAHRLWITDEFTTSAADHDAVIVHGHTIEERGVMITHNRIGVDTGAYRSGILSAVAIDGGEEWIITAEEDRTTRS